MNVECEICGRKNKGTKDQLIDKGWSGMTVNINKVKGKAEFCPQHSNQENTSAFVEKIKQKAINNNPELKKLECF